MLKSGLKILAFGVLCLAWLLPLPNGEAGINAAFKIIAVYLVLNYAEQSITHNRFDKSMAYLFMGFAITNLYDEFYANPLLHSYKELVAASIAIVFTVLEYVGVVAWLWRKTTCMAQWIGGRIYFAFYQVCIIVVLLVEISDKSRKKKYK